MIWDFGIVFPSLGFGFCFLGLDSWLGILGLGFSIFGVLEFGMFFWLKSVSGHCGSKKIPG